MIVIYIAHTLISNTYRLCYFHASDTDGGNALNVQRTVKDLIAAGAAGCFLEDQAWPKKCGHMHGKQIIPAEEHAAKIASARDAIGDSDFVLARADASFVEAPRNDNEANWVGSHLAHP
ncbi:hypothetical protein CUMW_138800 [Citrus unshiu]|uniref:Isocitrate lyase n=1 Tax=Citrus unshiu TaxID=55188 RepID=A0A2H5PIU1_CITUN|nr:hypothetical protein CUMW_138800 [Citrus unshiu]